MMLARESKSGESFNPLDHPIVFQVPRRVTDVSSWHYHIPFAFLLVELLRPRTFAELGTHKGDSFCAFCQAIDGLGLGTASYAVDTWRGDEHAGYYGEDVFDELRSYHDPLYGRFSRLVRSTFDEALPHFANDSIDLLHIDGLHSYEAVKHDFEAWLPKISERGVVLFHDVNVCERDFGVWRLWEELSNQYPARKFNFGHGLGVLGVGSRQETGMTKLFDLTAAEWASAEAMFYALGNRCYLLGSAKGLTQAVVERDQRVANLTQAVVERDQRVANLTQAVVERDQRVANLTQAVVERDQQMARLNKQLSSLYASKSWRFTSLLRRVGTFVRKVLHAVGAKRRRQTSIEGNLELPLPHSHPENRLLRVGGWVFCHEARIVSLSAVVDANPGISIQYGMGREDVAAAYPGVAQARDAGFDGCVVADPAQPAIALRIEAELDDGRRITALARQVQFSLSQPTTATSASRLFAVWFTGQVILKGIRALAKGRWPRSIDEARRHLRTLRNRYRPPQGGVPQTRHPWEFFDPYQRWISHNVLTPALRQRLQRAADALVATDGARISIIVPIFNTQPEFLRRMVGSIQGQIYQKWELCLADDASTDPKIRPYLEDLVRIDPRIKAVFRPYNGHIVEASNSALGLCTGEFVAFLDHDDELSPDALLHVAECIAKNPAVDWIYTDEDKIDAAGRRYDPQFKGAWSPEMGLTHNFTHHLTMIRRSLIEKVGAFRKGCEGAQDLDLFLRVAEATSPDRIHHLPFICYHWRAHTESTAFNGNQKRYIFESAERAVNDALERRGLRARAFLPELAARNNLCLYQVRWDRGVMHDIPVTIVIPTKDRVDLLKPCIDSLARTVNPEHVRLIVVDDRTIDPETLEYLEALPKHCRLSVKVIRPKRGDGQFNFARLINEAAEHIDTPAMLILNNDIEAVESGWLEDMVGWLSVPGVAAVGARLLFPDQRVQHAGVVVGPHDGLADHYFLGQHKDDLGYLFLARVARNVTAVIAACLLTRVETYRQLGGMDEQRFAIAYNDVDFCLRIWNSGERVVYTPQATLIHHTAASCGLDFEPAEHLNFIRRYPSYQDRFVNPALRQDSTQLELDPYHVVHTERIEALKVLMLTHNLNLEGAPIVAYEIARYLREHEGFEVVTLAPVDGPLRSRYAESDLPVTVLPVGIDENDSARAIRVKLDRLGRELAVQQYDLVACNTLNSFWGVDLARLFNRPSIWHIHESTTIEQHFLGWHTSVAALVASCLQHATRIVIAAQATARMYRYLDANDRIRVVPGGLPLERIAAFREANIKTALRAKHGLPADRKIVAVIGTTCERKGQHIFVSAAEQLLKTLPRETPAPLFLIVGGREGQYLDELRHHIRSVSADAFHLVMETPDIYDFFALSDLFVCSSFEESFPMVVLLAMAFGLPVVASAVYGIPEIMEENVDGLLVPPGQPTVLAEAIQRLLLDQHAAERHGCQAWHTVQRRFDNNKLMPRQVRLFREAVACHSENVG